MHNEKVKLSALSVFIFLSLSAQAANNCLIVGIDSDGFQEDCDENAKRSINEALPTFSDAFNMNPASLPTRAGRFVMEATLSNKATSVAGRDYQLGLIKGFNNFGLGTTSTPDNTFFDTNLTKKLSATQYSIDKETILPTYNAGMALSPWNKKKRIAALLPVIGYSLKLNQSRGTVGHVIGTSSTYKIFSAGLSFLQEPSTTGIPLERTFSIYGAMAYQALSVDASMHMTRYKYEGLGSNGNALQYFLNLSLHLRKFIGTYSFKTVKHLSDSVENLWMMSLQYNVHPRLRLMGMLNYVPGAKTLGLQLIL